MTNTEHWSGSTARSMTNPLLNEVSTSEQMIVCKESI